MCEAIYVLRKCYTKYCKCSLYPYEHHVSSAVHLQVAQITKTMCCLLIYIAAFRKQPRSSCKGSWAQDNTGPFNIYVLCRAYELIVWSNLMMVYLQNSCIRTGYSHWLSRAESQNRTGQALWVLFTDPFIGKTCCKRPLELWANHTITGNNISMVMSFNQNFEDNASVDIYITNSTEMCLFQLTFLPGSLKYWQNWWIRSFSSSSNCNDCANQNCETFRLDKTTIFMANQFSTIKAETMQKNTGLLCYMIFSPGTSQES